MAGTKRVFGKSSQVAHVWAQQTQAGGRNSRRSIYFEGATIFSYGGHFPMARFVTNKRGERAVLMTTQRYSSTTAKHLSDVRNAIQGLDLPVFEVDLRSRAYRDATPQEAKAEFEKQVKSALAKSEGARSLLHLKEYRRQAQAAVEQANAYSKFYSLRWRLKPIPPLDAERRAKAAAFDEKQNAAQAVRRADADAAWKAAKAKCEAEKAKARAEYPAQLEAWLAGGREELPSLARWGEYAYEKDTLLRVRGDVVDTSRGAQFPAEHAKLAFKVISRCKERGEGWQTNGHTVRLGPFKIDQIEPDGTVKAGCHTVKWPAIEHAARQLGLLR